MLKKTVKTLFGIYVATWLLAFVLILFQIVDEERSLAEGVSLFANDIAPNKTFLLILHALFFLLIGLFYSIRYFVRVYKRKGRAVFFKQLGLRCLLPVGLIFISFKTLIFANSSEISNYDWNDQVLNTSGEAKHNFERDGKHRGMSVFGWRRSTPNAVDDLIRVNVEWVAVVPFLFQQNERTKVVNTPEHPDRFSRRDSSFIRTITKLKEKDIYVHLKPHLWMRDGWRSNISLDSDEEWETWFQSYRTNMLRYARMAELTGVELFCVGTELSSSIKKQPEAWHSLITEIRSIYSGKLTYAANWHDEYEYVSFWKELDFIGIQAYFPLTDEKNPDLETIKQGWQPHIATLESFSKTHNKPILFTEVGYKSEASATIKPWEWGSALSILYRKKSDRTQRLAYEALFQELWHLDWFAGIYIWEWDTRSKAEDAPQNLNFSPRFKEAENLIAEWFGNTVPK